MLLHGEAAAPFRGLPLARREQLFVPMGSMRGSLTKF